MSSLAQMGELRAHPRVEFGRRAWCEHQDWTQYLPIANLSRGGLFIQTPTPFPPGELLRISFFDGGQRLVLEVSVVWSTRARIVGVGCRIDALVEGAERYAKLVDKLVNAR